MLGRTGVKRRWKKMVWRMPTITDQQPHQGYRADMLLLPLTTSLTLVRSAAISSVYSGGRRASMVGSRKVVGSENVNLSGRVTKIVVGER